MAGNISNWAWGTFFTVAFIPFASWTYTQRNECLTKAEAVTVSLTRDADEYFSREYLFREAIPLGKEVTQSSFTKARAVVLGQSGYSDESYKNKGIISLFYGIRRAWRQVDFSSFQENDMPDTFKANRRSLGNMLDFSSDYKNYLGEPQTGGPPPPNPALNLRDFHELLSRSDFSASCGYWDIVRRVFDETVPLVRARSTLATEH